jgi:putative glutamine amidotransferase
VHPDDTDPRPLLAVVDVSDAGRDDPAFHDVLGDLTSRAIAAGESAGFRTVRVAAEQLGTDGLLAATAAADALLVMGGEDVDPATYGGPADYPGRGQHFRAADDAEIALVRRAVADRVPTLGICRGMQVMNVALGGDLVQHLEHAGHVHPGAAADAMTDHDVALRPGSGVSAALGATTVRVRSSHHQAVGTVGDGLVVTATAPDGTVEAIEHRDAPVFAVQWHPEDAGAADGALTSLLAVLRPGD